MHDTNNRISSQVFHGAMLLLCRRWLTCSAVLQCDQANRSSETRSPRESLRTFRQGSVSCERAELRCSVGCAVHTHCWSQDSFAAHHSHKQQDTARASTKPRTCHKRLRMPDVQLNRVLCKGAADQSRALHKCNTNWMVPWWSRGTSRTPQLYLVKGSPALRTSFQASCCPHGSTTRKSCRCNLPRRARS